MPFLTDCQHGMPFVLFPKQTPKNIQSAFAFSQEKIAVVLYANIFDIEKHSLAF